MSKLLNLSEPQTRITPALYVAVKPITGKYVSHTMQTLKHYQYPQSHYLCSSALSIFSSWNVSHSSHLLGLDPIFKTEIKFPASEKEASPATLACINLGLHSEPHSSAALTWHRIHSLILWLAILYHPRPPSRPPEGKLQRGLGRCLTLFLNLSPLSLAHGRHLINISRLNEARSADSRLWGNNP